jgi:hypothetical protein
MPHGPCGKNCLYSTGYAKGKSIFVNKRGRVLYNRPQDDKFCFIVEVVGVDFDVSWNDVFSLKVERCKADINDYHRQIEQHRDSLMSQGGDAELRSKLSEKNKDLNRYLDEIRVR